MRILHLFSNHKLTGPAELALDTARALERHAPAELAIECPFLAGRHPSDPFWVGELARERGARLVELDGVRLSKHFNPLRVYRDARVLARYLETARIDIVHCHLPNDHMVASVAVPRVSGRRRIPIVRTVYDGDPLRIDWRVRRTFRRACDHVICFSEVVRDDLVGGPLGCPPDAVSRLEAPIDTGRFDPSRRAALVDARAALGIPAGAITGGIVARMQTHRRFEVLLEAIRMVRDRLPGFRFIIVGRGTNQVRVAREPVRRMGLEDTVIFAGYISGDEYVSTLLAMDLKVFLVPGSDGTCRAVREALASGVPVIAARRGILPELVEDGVTGRVVDDTAENLAGAMVELARDRDTRERMARTARERAVERFSYAAHARRLASLYASLLERGPRAGAESRPRGDVRRSSIAVLGAAVDRAWLLGAVEAHRRAVETGEGVLKNEHKTSIARVTHAGRRAIIKHYRYMGPRFFLKGLVRTPPSRRSLRAAAAMARRSVPTPAVLGLVERRRLGLPVESWLVTEEVPGAVEMDRYILRHLGPGCDPRRRRAFLDAFAERLAHLMRSGIGHRDLKTCNILVEERAGGWRFSFIDLDDVVVHPEGHVMGEEDWVTALSQLNPSTPKIVPWTDRLRFLDRLADLRRWDRRSIIAAVQELSRRRRRAYFSDEGPVEIDFV